MVELQTGDCAVRMMSGDPAVKPLIDERERERFISSEGSNEICVHRG